MDAKRQSDEIAATEMRPVKVMPRIILGRNESPYAVLRAEWYGVVWAMETRWYYQQHPEAQTLHGWADLPGDEVTASRLHGLAQDDKSPAANAGLC